MKKHLHLLILFSLLLPILSYAKLDASVNDPYIYQDEPFQYTLISDQSIQPDLEPLKQNFIILGQSTGRHISIINGRQTRTYKYTYTLKLKPGVVDLSRGNTGVMLPSIKAGNNQTRSIQLIVQKPSSKVQSQDKLKADIDVKATPDKPYVQQMITVEIEVLLNRNTASKVQAMRLAPFRIKNAITREFKEPIVNKKIIDNEPYVQIIKKLAVFPQNSKAISIPAITFMAKVVVDNQNGPRRANIFASPFLQQTKTLRLTSEPITIDTKPIPKDYKGTWLPTNGLKAESHLDPQSSTYQVGEAITRTISIEAENLTAKQLPEIKPQSVEHINIYPDKPQYNDFEDNENIHSQRIETFTYMATEPGQYTIPPITVKWFDLETGKPTTTTLPAKEITITPSPQSTKQPKQTDSADSPTTNQPDTNQQSGNSTSQYKTKTASDFAFFYWVIFSLIIFFVILYFYLKKHPPYSHTGASNHSKLPPRAALNLLEKEMDTNDPKQAKKAFNTFINQIDPKRLAKQTLLNSLSTETQQMLEKLDAIVYGNSASDFDAKKVFKLIKRDIEKALKQQKKMSKDKKNHIPDLYSD